jgi:phage tail-like protein
MNDTTRDPCAHDDVQGAPERPRYFEGKLLSEDDLNDEQEYHRSKRRVHNRLLHGWGVVAGLDVTAGESQSRVVLSPGYALDPCGNEILVPEPVTVDVSGALPAGVGGKRAAYLAVRYAESPSSPVPSPGGEEFGRMVEGFDIAVLTDLPDAQRLSWPPARDAWVVLADLVIGDDDSVAAIDPMSRRHATSARAGSAYHARLDETSAPSSSHELLGSSNFRVLIDGKERAFSFVGGLTSEDDDDRDRKHAGHAWRHVILRRAISQSKDLFHWRQAVAEGSDDRREVRIEQYDPAGERLVNAWTLHEAWPRRWSGPVFDAMTAAVAMEETELSARRVSWDHPKDDHSEGGRHGGPA